MTGRTAPVMHLVDTLEAGGAERMCVQLANAMAERGRVVAVCATRRSGPLREELDARVGFVNLGRRWRFDAAALWRLRQEVEQRGIRILHAHGTALFAAAAASAGRREVRVVWHDHYGGLIHARSSWPYRMVRRRMAAVLAVNEELARWSRERLGVSAERVFVVGNFATRGIGEPASGLPGTAGYRLVQVANVRPQKDYTTMLRAMARIVREEPRAHLLVVGACGTEGHGAEVRRLVEELGLAANVTFLGPRRDVGAVLAGCDVGVLSSASEGLPVALLEYGEAGLAAVCTDAGACRAVLDGVGPVVRVGDDAALAEAVLALLRDPEERVRAGGKLRERVRARWSREAVLERIEEAYEKALE
ncbi:MAG: glycosyl transferase [Bryobacteraceae bacterium]|nr:MAG: glycosyl transferase [Bryobacteraceae bacterium]